MAKSKSTVQQELTVQRRVATGSGSVKRLRSELFIPGVVYGKAMEPLAVAVPRKALTKVLHTKGGEHALVTLRLEDGASWEKAALIKEVQHDPVDGQVIHVDFHAIALTERIRVKIPVLLKGESVGVKQEAGILEQFLRELEVECLPTEIPEGVEMDVSALKIGDTVHVRDLTLPKNAKLLSDPAGAVASIQQPKVEKPEEAAAAVTEPEVIREKKEEGAEPAAEARPPGPPRASAGAGGSGEGRAGEAKTGPSETKKDAKSEK